MLKPCPFCGGTNTVIKDVTQWNGTRPPSLICVDVRHHCDKGMDTYLVTSIQLRARDREQAVKLWNRRDNVEPE